MGPSRFHLWVPHFEMTYSHLTLTYGTRITSSFRKSHQSNLPYHLIPQRNSYRELPAGARLNIKMTFYQYRKSHCGDKTVIRSSYLHNGISYIGEMSSLYWIRAERINPLTCVTLSRMLFFRVLCLFLTASMRRRMAGFPMPIFSKSSHFTKSKWANLQQKTKYIIMNYKHVWW